MPEPVCPEDHAVAISWAQGFENPARSFARKHTLPIINQLPGWRGLCFCLEADGWVLKDLSGEMLSPFYLQFEPRYVAQGKDPLLKAMGKAKCVLDLTAGWGGDALHIALSGRRVVSVERNPVVYQLLLQAQNNLADTELEIRLNFVHLDAARADFPLTLSRCPGSSDVFDLVYLDPMFTDKALNRARAKKPMRLMQRLTDVPSDSNEKELFDNAMAIAQKRVVVKRGLKAPYIAGNTPQGSIKSKLLRFDLYQP
jgi:16S rRNA (guanine1516-N2)-methyltransferase